MKSMKTHAPIHKSKSCYELANPHKRIFYSNNSMKLERQTNCQLLPFSFHLLFFSYISMNPIWCCSIILCSADLHAHKTPFNFYLIGNKLWKYTIKWNLTGIRSMNWLEFKNIVYRLAQSKQHQKKETKHKYRWDFTLRPNFIECVLVEWKGERLWLTSIESWLSFLFRQWFSIKFPRMLVSEASFFTAVSLKRQ